MALACWLSLQLATPVILSMNKENRRPRIVAEGSCSDALFRLPAPFILTPQPSGGLAPGVYHHHSAAVPSALPHDRRVRNVSPGNPTQPEVLAVNSPVYGPGWEFPLVVAQGVAGKPGLFLLGRTVYFCPFQPGVQQDDDIDRAEKRAGILAAITEGAVTPVVITSRLNPAQSAQAEAAEAAGVTTFVIPYP